jgi:Fe-S oxidoreductase
MVEALVPPAEANYWFVQGRLLFQIITLVGLACFAWIMARRLAPLARAQRDPRFDRVPRRLASLAKYWFGQWRHPRYVVAGTIHIFLFAGFLILVIHTVTLLVVGINPDFEMPGLSGTAGIIYGVVKDYAATLVFLAVTAAVVRRVAFRPARYSRSTDAVFLLALIGVLMAADAVFEGSKAAAEGEGVMAVLSLPWLLERSLAGGSLGLLAPLHYGSFLVHELAFFFLLCYRPFGIQFHVETSFFSVYFARLDRAKLKPVRWDVPEDRLDQVKSLGVKTIEDFTWKHLLDFYSCADCGRCSDQCPANAVGRPLSPRLLGVKGRDYLFEHFPVLGRSNNGHQLIGTVYSEDEVWSCTTCGACEQECPLLIEHIDKIVDLRRGLVDSGNVPQSLQKPLKALESRGNPFGKVEKKRGDWVRVPEFRESCAVRVLNGEGAGVLYFVDSITSYDERTQSIGRATARILERAGADFGILGAAERDSGHDVRRFGEEILFMALRDHNAEAIRASGAGRVVTADPHAFNSLKNDYRGIPPVEHISQFMAREIRAGKLKLRPVDGPVRVYTYHDPCYLGRHNSVFDEPREVLDAIPGLKRVEMARCRDRSFCCGGGGLALFYEPKEDERMGVKRVRMAAETGADVIVTACPFCMVNLEDAIKVAGMEGRMTVMDLAEVVEKCTVPAVAPALIPGD